MVVILTELYESLKKLLLKIFKEGGSSAVAVFQEAHHLNKTVGKINQKSNYNYYQSKR